MWGNNNNSNHSSKKTSNTSVRDENVNHSEKRTFFKLSDKFNNNTTNDFKSVKSLKNYWDNRIKLLSSSVPEQLNKVSLNSKQKSSTLSPTSATLCATTANRYDLVNNNQNKVKTRSTTLDSISAKNYLNNFKAEEKSASADSNRRTDVLSKFVPFYSTIFRSASKDQSKNCNTKSPSNILVNSNSKRSSLDLTPLSAKTNALAKETGNSGNLNKRFRPNSDIISCNNFPLIAATPSGSKIHWAKREDIFTKRNNKKQQQQQEEQSKKQISSMSPEQLELTPEKEYYNNNKKSINVKKSPNTTEKTIFVDKSRVINTNKKMSILKKENTNSSDTGGNQKEMNTFLSSDDKALSANNDKFVQNNNSKNSTISSNNSALDTPRKSSNPSRKYSFKTNTVSPYHKKMGSTSSGSKVAALTLRFNQMIQQDASLLDEVKKRGRTLHKTGNHVYKIKEESESMRRKTYKNDENSDCNSNISGRSGSKKSLVKKRPSIRTLMQSQQTAEITNAKTIHRVKDTIQLFEPHQEAAGSGQGSANGIAVSTPTTLIRQDSDGSNKVKPKIPDKSELVKKKTKDLQINNSNNIKGVLKNVDKVLNDKIPIANESPQLIVNNKNKNNDYNSKSSSVNKVLRSAIEIQIKQQALEEHEQMQNHLKKRYFMSSHTLPRGGSVAEKLRERPSELLLRQEKAIEQMIPEEAMETNEINQTESMVTAVEPMITETITNELPLIEPQSLSSDLETRKDDELIVDNSGKFKKKSPEESKNKLSKIYEKFRFRPFFSGPKNLSIKGDLKLSQSTPVLSEIQDKPEVAKHSEDELNPDHSLVDAICSVTEKIDSISKSTICLSGATELETPSVQPNQSFLFRSTSKPQFYSTCDITEDNTEIVEAFNNIVISKTQSMDELILPAPQSTIKHLPTVPAEDTMAEESEEVMMRVETVLSKHDEILEKTEIEKNIDSFVYVSHELCSAETAESVINANQGYSANCDNIYQALPSAKTNTVDDQLDNVSVNSYESFEQNNYEAVEDLKKTYSTSTATKCPAKMEDEYEICDPPEPPPPRKQSMPYAGNEFALPPPQRNVNNTASSNVNNCASNYERIKYEDVPARPPKSPNLQPKTPIVPLPPRNAVANGFMAIPPAQPPNAGGTSVEEEIENEYEENIYDFIKHHDDHSHRGNINYESLIKNNSDCSNHINIRKSYDSVSMLSNCYESINLKHDFIRQNGLHYAGSLTTLSSDHKTNSLYGMSGVQSITPPSERGSDASDEWVDISDEEDEHTKMKFIITREKSKCHRSPDWSRKVRDQRKIQMMDDVSVTSSSSVYLSRDLDGKALPESNKAKGLDPLYENTVQEAASSPVLGKFQTRLSVWNKSYSFCPLRYVQPFLQIIEKGDAGSPTDIEPRDAFESQTLSVFIDDTEHLYEPLFSTKRDGHNGDMLQMSTNSSMSSSSTNHYNSPKIPYKVNNNTLIENDVDFDDSFESDMESDEDLHHKMKTDSGVDISNAKLPDPPTQTGQVYAFMQKIKNFGTLSKYELSKGLSKISKKKSSSSLKQSQQDLTTMTTTTTTSTGQIVNHKSNSDGHYDDPNYYVNTTFGDKKTTTTSNRLKYLKSFNRRSAKNVDPYENTEFHTPRSPITPTTPTTPTTPPVSSPTTNSINEKVSSESCINDKTKLFENLTRRKSKSDKSIKSKLRKSLASDYSINLGNSLNGTRSTFYISDSVDVDSGFYTDRINTSDDLSPIKPVLNDSTSSIQPEAPARNNSKGVSTGSPDLGRRRATFSNGRPNNPPPPPPTTTIDKKSGKSKQLGKTSWYAECGVFKSESLENCKSRNLSTSWYADAGLYQTSGVSVASSSGSSGVSTGGEGGPGDDNSHSMFLNEPLYQIYSAAKLESISSGSDADHSDGYEEIGENKDGKKVLRPSRPSALELIEPNQGRPSRTLWSEVSEVIKSEILLSLTAVNKRLQEAKFEILTSEASYLKSLNLLKSHFMYHPSLRDPQVLSSADRKTLFSFITPVLECSDRLLCDLESCWQNSIMLSGMSNSIYKHAEKHFQIYISYCENQGKLDRTLRRLKDSKGQFVSVLEVLESEPSCCSLSLHSFLMLPMQRITRLPLLVDAVLSKLKEDDDEYESWKMTLAILNKIVANCNEAANRSEQAFEMECISRQIEFPSNILPVAIIPVGTNLMSSGSRTLVKRGELIHLVWRGEDAKLTFGKKFAKNPVYAFLFTDIFVLTKRKNDESYTVIDYCPRSLLNVSSGDVIPQLPTKEMMTAGKHLILLTLLENYEGKTIEMILSCSSETERQRWLKVTEPVCSENPEEKLYEQWDCPQVLAKHNYQALQPDELNLEVGDTVNVTRKMVDGWYHGERMRDGVQGWFPGNFVEEVASQHVRAKNLKQRYRLLTFTATYLDSQKNKKLN